MAKTGSLSPYFARASSDSMSQGAHRSERWARRHSSKTFMPSPAYSPNGGWIGFLDRKKVGSTAASGHKDYYMCTPPGWPSVERSQQPQNDYDSVMRAIERAGVGREPQSSKGLAIDMGDEILPLPRHIETQEGAKVPILLIYGPNLGDPMDVPILLMRIRGHPYFRSSPIAVYSVVPIPETVSHYAGNTPAALLDSQLRFYIDLRKNVTPEMIRITVVCIWEFMGIEIRLEPAGLVALDEVLARMHWRDPTEPSKATLFALGLLAAYVCMKLLVGPSYVRRPGERFDDVEVPLEDGRTTRVNFLKPVEERIRNGGPGVADVYRDLKGRVRRA